MKTLATRAISGTILAGGLAIALLAPAGAQAASGGNGLILNETFDPPAITLFGWDAGVSDISRTYVDNGVKGSTAVKVAGTFTAPSGNFGTMLVQNGTVMNNARSTAESSRLSFDIKVEQPGLKAVTFGLQSWDGYVWFGAPHSSVAAIPLGNYTPGKFQTIVVPLDDPMWVLDPDYPGALAGPFDPQGKTYQIFVSLGAGDLPSLGPVAVTIDSIQIITKHPLVPYSATARGTAAYDEATGVISLAEKGVAGHLGNFTSAGTVQVVFMYPDGGLLWGGPMTITTANGDKLFGVLYTFDFLQSFISFEGGTGKFAGAAGSYVALLQPDDPTFASYSLKGLGSISTVGSNK